MGKGKPSGMLAGGKLERHRRDQKWHDKEYNKAHGISKWKTAFGGASHASGIVTKKLAVEAKQPNSASRKCVKVQLRKNHIRDVEHKFIVLNKKKALFPSNPKLISTKDMEVFEIEMQDGDGRYRDIGIAGLGWISMRSMNQTIRIYLPKGVSLYTSRPKIKSE